MFLAMVPITNLFKGLMSFRSHPRSIAWVALVTCLPACSSWKVSTVPPAQLLADEPPAKIRITLADSSKVVLSQPELVEDTLVGQSGDHQMRVATADAVHLAVRRKDAVSTVGLTVGLVGGLWLVAFIASRETCYVYC